MKLFISGFVGSIILLFSFLFYINALEQGVYLGLPTVACIDQTKPVVQNYSLTIHITIHKNPLPLTPTIGHDFGKCLHEIFVTDDSGTVFVKTNGTQTYTLGQFFDVWRKTFSSSQIGDDKGTVVVFVNGAKTQSIRDTPLLPNQRIAISLE